MATVNFSVPDDVKAAFDQTFAGKNKSAILTDLMRKAIKEAELTQRRQVLVAQLTAKRISRPAMTEKSLRNARRQARK